MKTISANAPNKSYVTVFERAEHASREVMASVIAARSRLEQDPVQGGLGVLADPGATLATLRSARAELDAAVKMIEATNWPSAADYEQARVAATRINSQRRS